MFIYREQIKNIHKFLKPNKVVILFGARRTGKTTLLRQFLNEIRDKKFDSAFILFLNGDDIYTRQFMETQSVTKLKEFIGNKKLLVIDEAQYIHGVGLNLKLIVDHIPNIHVLISGSSSFQSESDTGEPLTGRKFELRLFPFSQSELASLESLDQTSANLESRLIYGSYPEVVLAESNEIRKAYLNDIMNSYLLKDVLSFEGLKKSNKLIKLLILLAFQVGKPISVSELATQLGMSKNTVDRYIDLLEKTFVIFSLTGFSRNLRKEISKNRKIYFWDCGIRNVLIGNFNPLKLRNDIGELWENYLIAEHLKISEYRKWFSRYYYWRTYDRQEIDLVEKKDGRLFAYEFKWKHHKVKAPAAWQKAYPEAKFTVIDQSNYLSFICP